MGPNLGAELAAERGDILDAAKAGGVHSEEQVEEGGD